MVLPLRNAQGAIRRLYLGPTALTGGGVDGADSKFNQGQGYVVNVKFNDTGATKFDQLAAQSFPQTPPQNQVAIVLDGVIQSAPAFQAASFSGDVQISGSFSPEEASPRSSTTARSPCSSRS